MSQAANKEDRPEFLGGLGFQEFLDKHWQKAPLFVPGGFPEWVDFLTPDELAGFSLEEAVESRIIIEHAPDNWELRHGPFSEDSFASLPKTHWTLLIQALDHYVPELAHLLDQFNFLPQWRIDDLMMSYAPTGGSVGPHYDYYDVFLIQISGRRQWQTGQHCHDQTPLIDGLPVRILREFSVADEWTVQPGDVLYLPPGVAHHGVALDDDCLTLSVGFRAPSYSDILSEYSHAIAAELPGSVRYQDTSLKARTRAGFHSGILAEEDIDSVQQKLSDLINNRQKLGLWMAEYLSLPKYENETPQPCELATEEIEALLRTDCHCQRDENSRFIWWAGESEPVLFINGDQVPYPEPGAPLAEYLSIQRCFSGQELLALASDTRTRTWLLHLIRQGLLYLHGSQDTNEY